MTTSLCGRTGQLHGHGYPVFESIHKHHLAMWRVRAIALSFVSGWRAFSSVSLCKSIQASRKV
jgi:hypothetical protein